MQEILFRGKRLDGAWETGSLVRWHLGLSDERAYIDDMAMYNTPVDAKTVGQYIGLCDKNGQKIFEGDIVRRDNKNFNISYVESLAQFIAMDCQHTGYPMPLTSTSVERMEVVGNIWDNPELTVGGGNTMNKQDKPLSEWTLGELRDCCNGVFCEDCPAGHYRENGICQFSDCGLRPGSWDFLNAPSGDTPTPEPETDKSAKPRLAEILGVEVGERFTFDYEYAAAYATAEQCNSCYVGNDGFIHFSDGIWWNGTAVCDAINHPERIIHKPRLTEPELAICRAVGAKYVSLDRGVAPDVELWEYKPDWNGAFFDFEDSHVNKRLARVDASLFPSVKPGDCIAVEEASGNV